MTPLTILRIALGWESFYVNENAQKDVNLYVVEDQLKTNKKVYLN